MAIEDEVDGEIVTDDASDGDGDADGDPGTGSQSTLYHQSHIPDR